MALVWLCYGVAVGEDFWWDTFLAYISRLKM
jgi:hypothetical protein